MSDKYGRYICRVCHLLYEPFSSDASYQRLFCSLQCERGGMGPNGPR